MGWWKTAFRSLPIETKDESFFSWKIRTWLSGPTHVQSRATPISFMAGAQTWSRENRIHPDFLIVQGKCDLLFYKFSPCPCDDSQGRSGSVPMSGSRAGCPISIGTRMEQIRISQWFSLLYIDTIQNHSHLPCFCPETRNFAVATSISE